MIDISKKGSKLPKSQFLTKAMCLGLCVLLMSGITLELGGIEEQEMALWLAGG